MSDAYRTLCGNVDTGVDDNISLKFGGSGNVKYGSVFAFGCGFRDRPIYSTIISSSGRKSRAARCTFWRNIQFLSYVVAFCSSYYTSGV